MVKLRIKNLHTLPDNAAMVNRCVSTVDGLEQAHINLSTGEITYSSEACIDESLLREAFLKEGIEVESVD